MADKVILDYPAVAPLGTDSLLVQRGGTYQRILVSDLVALVSASTGGVLSGHGNPVADPGVPSAKYTNLDDSTEWYWDDGAGQWFKQG